MNFNIYTEGYSYKLHVYCTLNFINSVGNRKKNENVQFLPFHPTSLKDNFLQMAQHMLSESLKALLQPLFGQHLLTTESLQLIATRTDSQPLRFHNAPQNSVPDIEVTGVMARIKTIKKHTQDVNIPQKMCVSSIFSYSLFEFSPQMISFCLNVVDHHVGLIYITEIGA